MLVVLCVLWPKGIFTFRCFYDSKKGSCKIWYEKNAHERAKIEKFETLPSLMRRCRAFHFVPSPDLETKSELCNILSNNGLQAQKLQLHVTDYELEE